MNKDTRRSLTIGLKDYAATRYFLRTMNGVSNSLYRSTDKAIWDWTGSPQEPKRWANPDIWIIDRLQAKECALAKRIWDESDHKVNPRYLRPHKEFTHKNGLLVRNSEGLLEMTEAGMQFLNEPEGQVVAEVDRNEGVLAVLRLVTELGPGKLGEFRSEFTRYCEAYTTSSGTSSIQRALSGRLRNLRERGYVQQRSQRYEVTELGLQYIERCAALFSEQKAKIPTPADNQLVADRAQLVQELPILNPTHLVVTRLSKQVTREAREQLGTYLSEMDPFRFEELVKFLLEEMGYTDVETTSLTNDKGVDVVANIELGISSVREVIQVKRHRGNINRTILDQLRGSLHRFNAVRGTIITTGGYSRGTMEAAFEPGAAPITLIDGKKLIDLLVEHEIGVTKTVTTYLEFDVTKLAQFDVDEESLVTDQPDGTDGIRNSTRFDAKDPCLS